MTGQEIYDKTCQLATRFAKYRQDHQKIRHFAETLKSMDDFDVFAGLMPFFEESGYDGEGAWRQEVAGRLLAYRMPAPQKNLVEIIRASAPHYNLSIEQFPWYLALAFGREEFRDKVSSLLCEELMERERKTLDVFLFWTSLGEEQIRAELSHENDSLPGRDG